MKNEAESAHKLAAQAVSDQESLIADKELAVNSKLEEETTAESLVAAASQKALDAAAAKSTWEQKKTYLTNAETTEPTTKDFHATKDGQLTAASNDVTTTAETFCSPQRVCVGGGVQKDGAPRSGVPHVGPYHSRHQPVAVRGQHARPASRSDERGAGGVNITGVDRGVRPPAPELRPTTESEPGSRCRPASSRPQTPSSCSQS